MKNLIILCLFLLPLFTTAQKTHTVGAKESLFSIGRMYNVHPRELADYNNISFDAGLTIGQVLRIPSTKTMAPVNETPSVPVAKAPEKKAATGAPVYHTVAAKEGLYGISKRYDVTIDQIKQWNRLEAEGLSIGQQLIVGYSGSAPLATVQKEAPKPVVVEKNAEPVATPVTTNKPAPAEKVRQVTDRKGGYFKSLYEGGTNTQSGTAGVFKSTSGWEDGKYYCLHNTAPAGTIVKITNSANNKSVYAKVLDLIPDIKQNESVNLRVSNAAASELGAGMDDFAYSVEW